MNIAFVIPIHPPKYNYIYNLIEKFKKYNIKIDIYLIFSSQNDYNAFNMKSDIHYFIASFDLKLDDNGRTPIVTCKKFFALKQLCNSTEYDYFICCDSEIDIIPENFTCKNLNDKIENIFNNKLIYAGNLKDNPPNLAHIIPPANNVNKKSAKLLLSYYDKLKTITDDFNLFFWWSDLPVYRKTDLIDFFNTININNYQDMQYEQFDYIIYQYYLIIKHNFKIINHSLLTNCYYSLEYLWDTDINMMHKLSDLKVGFSWCSKRVYEHNRDFLLAKKLCIIFHIDCF